MWLHIIKIPFHINVINAIKRLGRKGFLKHLLMKMYVTIVIIGAHTIKLQDIIQNNRIKVTVVYIILFKVISRVQTLEK